MDKINVIYNETSSVECLWRLELCDTEGNICEVRDWQKNMVLDDGLQSLISTAIPFYNTNGGLYSKIAVGSGTTQPTEVDNQLESFLCAKTIDLTHSSGSYVNETYDMKPIVYTYMASFGVNEAVGSVSEVGLTSSTANTAGTYFCRNLIRVANVPTPIVKDNTHVLNVYLKVAIRRPFNRAKWVTSLTSTGTLSQAYSITGCLNNAWAIQSVVQSKNYNTNRYLPWTAGTVIGASTSWVSAFTSGNISYPALTSPTTGTASTGSIVSTGCTHAYRGYIVDSSGNNRPLYDSNYFINLKVDIPKADLNMNIRSMFIKGFFQPSVVTGFGVSEAGLFLQFDPVLAKTSSNTLSLSFTHTWSRF